MFWKPQKVLVQVQATLQWQVGQDPESGMWVGVCPALNLNALGSTWSEFQACANDATAGLFSDLFETGELDQFLRQNGWSLQTPMPAPGSRPRFEVPAEVRILREREQIANLAYA